MTWRVTVDPRAGVLTLPPRAARFIVPGLPRPKERPRLAPSGHVYTPRQTQDYERHVQLCYRGVAGGGPPRFAAIAVAGTVRVFWPTMRWGDLDNVTKAVLDALNGHAYVDDKQVIELHLYQELDRQAPRVDVLLEPRPGATFPSAKPKAFSTNAARAAFPRGRP